jgi:hypothetical protein
MRMRGRIWDCWFSFGPKMGDRHSPCTQGLGARRAGGLGLGEFVAGGG